MKKIILALAFSLPLLGFSQALTNKTFDANITGWQKGAGSGSTVAWDGTVGATSLGCIKMVAAAANTTAKTSTDAYPISGVGDYQITFKVKGPIGATVRADVQNGTPIIQGTASATLTGGWDTYTYKFTNLANDPVTNIRLVGIATGTYYFDDVEWTGVVTSGYTTLSIATSNSFLGTVTGNPMKVSYPTTDVVTVTATPKSHAVLNGWSGDLSGTTNPATLTMDTNKSVTGNFVVDPSFNYAYYFNTAGDLEGWDKTTDTTLSISQAGGIVTLTPTANQYTRFSLTGFPIPTGTYNKVTVKLQNLSTTTNQIGLTLNNGGSDVNVTYPITTADTSYKTYTLYFDASSTGLSGNLSNFRIKFSDTNNTSYSGRPSDAGQILIDDIIFSYENLNKNDHTFDTLDNWQGETSANNNSTVAVSGGKLIVTPAGGINAKAVNNFYTVDASNKIVHILYKNNSANNNTLRVNYFSSADSYAVLKSLPDQTILTNGQQSEAIFDASAVADWTGTLRKLSVILTNTTAGVLTPTSVDTGTFEIDRIVINNSNASLSVNNTTKSKNLLQVVATASQLNFRNATVTKATIYSMNGQLVKEAQVKNNVMDISALKAGVYVIRLVAQDQSETITKFIKN